MRWGALASALVLASLVVPGAGGSEAAKPRFGGTVVVVQPFGPPEPACLGPLAPCAGAFSPALPSDESIVNQVLEGAFEVAPDLTYRPNLVSRVSMRRRPFTLTYHIRRGARWGDGTALTARDFVFTYELLRKTAGPADPIRMVRDVHVVDAKTVRVSFSGPVASWRELFHRVYPHVLEGEDLDTVWRDGIVDPKTGKPTGTGPFLVERWERGLKLTLVRNRYWGPRRPYLDRIVFRFDLTDQATTLGNGLHLAATFRNPGQHATAGPGWEQIAIRIGPGGHPALQNVLVRKALAYGIDRASLLRRLSYGPVTRLLDNGILLTNSRFYERHWHVYRYRPAEARRLLEQAGCTRGADAINVCSGRRLSLRLVARGFHGAGGSEIERSAIPMLQQQLRDVGIELLPVLFEPHAFFDTVLGGDFDLALFTLPGGPEPNQSRWPGSAVEVWGCGGQGNFTGYCNRLVTRKLLQSRAIVDQKTRMRLLNDVDALMARDVPMIPLFQPPWMLSYTPTLRGVENNPWEGFTWNSEDWWLER